MTSGPGTFPLPCVLALSVSWPAMCFLLNSSCVAPGRIILRNPNLCRVCAARSDNACPVPGPCHKAGGRHSSASEEQPQPVLLPHPQWEFNATLPLEVQASSPAKTFSGTEQLPARAPTFLTLSGRSTQVLKASSLQGLASAPAPRQHLRRYEEQHPASAETRQASYAGTHWLCSGSPQSRSGPSATSPYQSRGP